MSQIRRQSILSTVLVYAGFAAGFVNTYLFTRQGSPFSPSQYAMTSIFLAVGNLMYAFSSLGMVSVVYKFYPYYKDNLPQKKIDLMGWSILFSLIGFLLMMAGAFIFKDLIVQKFAGNSPLFLQYFRWIFPFAFGILFFSLFEAFGWNIRQSVFTTFLRELFFKGLITILILMLSVRIISDFDSFIKLYSLTFGFTALILMLYLIYKKAFSITLKLSQVTRKFYRKIRAMALLSYLSSIVYMVANFIDMLIIMSLLGTTEAGIYSLGLVIGSLVQAPQRGAVAAAIPVVSQAWKDKEYEKIQRIYHRSGLNLLIGGLAIFFLVWMSYTDIVNTFHLQPAYLSSLWVFFFIGLARVVDMGTGINSQIISTSAHWRFEVVAGIIVLLIIIPVDYMLIKRVGIVGAGIATLFSALLFNLLRIIFLYRKFRMYPFSWKMALSIIVAVGCYVVSYYLFRSYTGFVAIASRSLVFIVLFASATMFFKLTPDIVPVLQTLRKRITGRR